MLKINDSVYVNERHVVSLAKSTFVGGDIIEVSVEGCCTFRTEKRSQLENDYLFASFAKSIDYANNPVKYIEDEADIVVYRVDSGEFKISFLH